ncbi:hypothetical protein BC829DRAFT_401332 [Chytridium lagenaria]|nr:hypothetical protein BC829DRAFT_401332 [Chytridium lagenaria]
MERGRNGSGSMDDVNIPTQGSPRSRSMAPSIALARSKSTSSTSSSSLPQLENRPAPPNLSSALAKQLNAKANGSTASDAGGLASQHSLVGDLNPSTSYGDMMMARTKKRASMTNSHFQKIIPSPLVDPGASAGSVTASMTQSTNTIDLEDDGGEGTYSPIPSRPSQAKKKVDMRRLAMYEDVILRLREPGTGLDLKDRSRMFKQYPQTFLGSEIVEWLIQNCNLLTKDEGNRFASNLFEAGYLISVDLLDKFTPDSSVYVFQTSYFWPSIRFTPADKDYLAYLLRRNQRTTAKYQLTDTEDRRLLKLKRRFRKQREEIEALVKEQNDHIDLLSKAERRLFSLQEYAFWRMQRPLDPLASYLPTKEDDALEKRSQTEAQYEAKLTDAERLSFWEKKRDTYDASLSLNRVKVSTSARALLQRCEIMRAFDPFMDSSIPNPFITDDTKVWEVERTVPAKRDLLLWCHSFQDLLRDPVGVKYFRDFLKTEFSTENLDFHLRVDALGHLVTYQEFAAEAESIFDEFIHVGSPRELNITSGTRTGLIQQFTAVKNAAIAKAQGTSTASLATIGPSNSHPAVFVQTGSAILAPVSGEPPSAAVPSTPTPVTAVPTSPTPHLLMSSSQSSHSFSSAVGVPSTLSHSASVQSTISQSYRKANQQQRLSNRLSNFVFRDAQEHIVQLMAKDSYNRFLASAGLQSLLAREGVNLEALAAIGQGAVKGNMSRRNLVLG